ncbi:MAG: hypothetical protein ACREWG_06205, partial [Gammaproteobacteria bacterium]
AQVEDTPAPIGDFVAGIPEVLERAVFRAMEKAPEDRFQSAADFIDALAPIVPRRPRTPENAAARRRELEERRSPEEARTPESPVSPRPDFGGAVRDIASDGSLPTRHGDDSGLPAQPPAPAAQANVLPFPVMPGERPEEDETQPRRKPPPAGGEGTPIRFPTVGPESVKKPGRNDKRGLLRALGVLFTMLAGIAAWVLWLQPPGPAAIRALVDKDQEPLADGARQDAARLERTRRIEDLLAQARSALQAERYSEAAGSAQQVLSIEAGHTEARGIVKDALGGMIVRAEDALTRGAIEAARRAEQEARGLSKDHGLADQAVSALSARIAVQEKAQAEQVATAKRLDALVALALRAASLDRWTEPPGDNVAEYARQALTLVPPGTAPTQLLSGVLEAGIKRAETALNAGDLEAASQLVASLQKAASAFKVNLPELDRIYTAVTAEEDRRRQTADQQKQQAEQAAKAQRVSELSDQATQAAALGRWMAPRDGNAVEYARQALARAAPGADPAQVLSGVFEAGISGAETALQAGDLKAAAKAAEAVRQFAKTFKVTLPRLEALSGEVAAETNRRRQLAEQEQRQAEQAAKARRVSELTAKATQAAALGRWIAPRRGNATEYARQALALAAPGADPTPLLSGVLEAGVSRAEAARKAGNFKAAAKAVESVRQFAKTFKVTLPRLEAVSGEVAAEEARSKDAETRTARDAEVGRLVEKARRALVANRLTSPANESAVAYLRQLTRLDAQNTDATRIASAVVARYVGLAGDALKRRDPALAETHRSSASRVAAEFSISDAGLDRLPERIAALQGELDTAAAAWPALLPTPESIAARRRELEERRSREDAAVKREAAR